MVIGVDLARQVALRQALQHGADIVERPRVGIEQGIDARRDLLEEAGHLAVVNAPCKVAGSSCADDLAHLLLNRHFTSPVAPFHNRAQTRPFGIENRAGDEREVTPANDNFRLVAGGKPSQHVALMCRILVIDIETGTEDGIGAEIR